ncbi:hypothetical protein LO772_07355 [Yinghuangia sp. ASG 101]|uniref:hypothetical protein n=1 Tax=Yinghuangia sp. ASG 101 TaxID=2896848 RepID=UPI001E37D4C1|nr:hypothetical protein [Yinghuangia sp. ASG 101]UGQ13417.1 hypothetical protein LO772_07355 [Yinghuangia sp. ASG 101]
MPRLIDAALGMFRDAGLNDAQAAYATTTMIQYVAGVADIQRGTFGRGAEGAVHTDGFGEPLAGPPGPRAAVVARAGPRSMRRRLASPGHGVPGEVGWVVRRCSGVCGGWWG